MQLSVHTGIDPDLTAAFLCGQPHVHGASVWYAKGRLHAEVTVDDNVPINAGQLIEACSVVLGDDQAPADVTLLAIRNRAA